MKNNYNNLKLNLIVWCVTIGFILSAITILSITLPSRDTIKKAVIKLQLIKGI